MKTANQERQACVKAMKYIIHIGQSKTGTSSLQACLAANRHRVRAQGVLYPDIYIKNQPLDIQEVNAMVDGMVGFPRFPRLSTAEYFEQFEQQAAAHHCDTIILSAESFFGSPQIWRFENEEQFWATQDEKLRVLQKYLSGRDVQIIGYLKPQDEWFESAVSQIISTEILLGHRLYESDEHLFELLKPHLNYQRILAPWRTAFGAQAMSIFAFDPQSLIHKNIIHDFCAHTGLDCTAFTVPDQKENISWDRRFIWLKNRLNKNRRFKVRERTTIALINALNAKLPAIQKYKISNALRHHIYETYAPMNEEICTLYDIERPNVLTRPPKAVSDTAIMIPEVEKQAAKQAYQKAMMSPKAAGLAIRYASGAMLRRYAPYLNTLVKQVMRGR